eukprot:g2128.t1
MESDARKNMSGSFTHEENDILALVETPAYTKRSKKTVGSTTVQGVGSEGKKEILSTLIETVDTLRKRNDDLVNIIEKQNDYITSKEMGKSARFKKKGSAGPVSSESSASKKRQLYGTVAHDGGHHKLFNDFHPLKVAFNTHIAANLGMDDIRSKHKSKHKKHSSPSGKEGYIIKSLQRTVNHLRGQNNNLRDANITLHGQIDRLQVLAKQQETELFDLRESSATKESKLEAEVVERNDTLLKLEKELEATTNSAKRKILELEEQNDDLRKTIKNWNTFCDSLQKELHQINGTKEAKIRELLLQLKDVNQVNNSLEEKLAQYDISMTTDRENYTKAILDANTKVETLKNQIRDLEIQNHAFQDNQNERDQLKEKLSHAQDQLSIANANDIMKKKIDELQEHSRAKLEDALKEKAQELNDARKGMEILQKKVLDLQLQHQEESGKYESELLRTRHELQTLREKVAHKDNQLLVYKTTFSKMRIEVNETITKAVNGTKLNIYETIANHESKISHIRRSISLAVSETERKLSSSANLVRELELSKKRQDEMISILSGKLDENQKQLVESRQLEEEHRKEITSLDQTLRKCVEKAAILSKDLKQRDERIKVLQKQSFDKEKLERNVIELEEKWNKALLDKTKAVEDLNKIESEKEELLITNQEQSTALQLMEDNLEKLSDLSGSKENILLDCRDKMKSQVEKYTALLSVKNQLEHEVNEYKSNLRIAEDLSLKTERERQILADLNQDLESRIVEVVKESERCAEVLGAVEKDYTACMQKSTTLECDLKETTAKLKACEYDLKGTREARDALQLTNSKTVASLLSIEKELANTTEQLMETKQKNVVLRSDAESLKTKNDKLQHQNKELIRTSEDLKDQVSHLKDEVHLREERLIRLEDDHARLEKKCKDVESRENELKQEVKKLDETLRTCIEKASNLQSEKNMEEESNRRLKEKNKLTEESLTRLQKTSSEQTLRERDLSSMNTSLQQEIDTIRNELDATRQKLYALQERDLSTQADLVSDRDKLNSKLLQTESKLNTMKNSLDISSKNENDLRKDLDDKTKEISKLKTSEDQLKRNLSSTKTQLEELQRENHSLEVRLSRFNKNVDELKRRLNEKEKKVSIEREHLASSQNELDKIKLKLGESKNSLDADEKNIRLLKEELSRKTKEIARITSARDKYQEDLIDGKSQIATLETQKNDVAKALENASSKISEMEANAEKKDTDITRLRKNVRQLQDELQDVQKELASTQNSLDAAEKKNKVFHEDLESKEREIKFYTTARDKEIELKEKLMRKVDRLEKENRSEKDLLRNSLDSLKKMKVEHTERGNQLSKLRNERDALVNEKTELSTKLAEAENSVDAMSKNIEVLREDNDRKLLQTQSLTKDRDKIQDELLKVRRDLAEAQAQAKHLSDLKEEIQTKFYSSTVSIETLQKDLSDLKRTSSDEILSVKTERDRLLNELHNARQHIASIEKTMEEHEAALREFKEKIAEAKNERDGLVHENNKLSTKLAEAENSVDAMSKNIEVLREDNDRKLLQTQSLTKDRDKIQDELLKVRRDLAEAQAQAKHLSDLKEEIQTKFYSSTVSIETLQKDLSDLKKATDQEISRLSKKLADAENSVDSMSKNAEVLREDNDRKLKQIESVSKDRDKIQNELLQARRDLTEAQAQLKHLTSLKKEMQTKYDTSKALIETLQKQLTALKQVSGDEILNIKAERDKLHAELTKARQDTVSLEKTIEEHKASLREIEGEVIDVKRGAEKLKDHNLNLKAQTDDLTKTLLEKEKNYNSVVSLKDELTIRLQDKDTDYQEKSMELERKCVEFDEFKRLNEEKTQLLLKAVEDEKAMVKQCTAENKKLIEKMIRGEEQLKGEGFFKEELLSQKTSNQSLLNKIKQLEVDIKAVNLEKKVVEEKYDALEQKQNQASQNGKTVLKLEKDLDDTKRLLKSVNLEKDVITKHMAKHEELEKKTRKALESTIASLKHSMKDIKELKEREKALKGEISELQKQLKNAGMDKINQGEVISNLELKSAEEREKLQDTNKNLEEELASKKKDLQAREEQLQQLSKASLTLADAEESLRQENQTLKDRVEQLVERLGTIDEIAQKISLDEETKNDLQKKANDLEKKNTILEEKVKRYSKRLASIDKIALKIDHGQSGD